MDSSECGRIVEISFLTVVVSSCGLALPAMSKVSWLGLPFSGLLCLPRTWIGAKLKSCCMKENISPSPQLLPTSWSNVNERQSDLFADFEA